VSDKGYGKGGWDHKKMIKSDRYQYDQGKRRIQWDRAQIRVPGRGSYPWKKRIKNNRYHSDQGKESNPM
jgi:hypothetical protein